MKKADRKQWTTLFAFLRLLLFAGATDGLMDVLGPVGFLGVGAVVMSVAWGMVEVSA